MRRSTVRFREWATFFFGSGDNIFEDLVFAIPGVLGFRFSADERKKSLPCFWLPSLSTGRDMSMEDF
jgi:hypothetical protein